MTAPPVVLRARALWKRFPGTQALRGAGIELRRGEVHALLGGNGSGKSTLVKILAGVVSADRGLVDADDRTLDARRLSPQVALDLGLGFVHQEDACFPSLSVAENLFGQAGYPRGRCGRIRWSALHLRAQDVLDRFAIDAEPRARLEALPPATRRMVEIARVLQSREDAHGGVLVLDEPSAALPTPDVERLHAALRRFAATGQAILYVTHRLNELDGFADRATVLRDGGVAGAVEREGLQHDRLVELIAGAALVAPRVIGHPARSAGVRLELRGCTAGALVGVDLAVRGGEVVGVAGLAGSGRSSLLRLACGLLEHSAGEVRVDAPLGKVAYVPESRDDAAFPHLSLLENLSAASLDRYRRPLGWRRGAERQDGRETVLRFGIQARSLDQPFVTLSGGNQQRTVLARWLRQGPSVLLLDEPTQGVDIAARAEIHQLIREAARRGAGVLLVSADLEELAALSDRVAILVRGRGSHVVEGADVNSAYLEGAVYGSAEQHVARKLRLLQLGEAWALVALTGALVLLLSLYAPTSGTFPTAANLQAIAGSQAVPLLVALAALVPLVCNEIDLSVGSVAGLSAALAAYALGHGVPVLLALAIGVAAGVVVGLTNGVLVTRAGVSGVIVTLGIAAVIGGVVLAVTGGKSLLFGIPTGLTEFGSENVAGLPAIALASVAVACLVYYVLEHTVLGRQLAMLGSNRRAALLVGLRPARLLVTSFAIAGGLAGLAGVLLLARVGGADPHAGPALTLPALAAAFLSGAAIRPGHYNAGGVVTAVAFLAVLNSGLNLAGSPPYMSEIVNGVALIAGVALAAYLGRKREVAA